MEPFLHYVEAGKVFLQNAMLLAPIQESSRSGLWTAFNSISSLTCSLN